HVERHARVRAHAVPEHVVVVELALQRYLPELRLQLLQADDLRPIPREQLAELLLPRPDAVNVPGDNLHSGSMPASFTILAHLAVSAAIYAAKASGSSGSMLKPNGVSAWRTSALLRATAAAAHSALIAARGVPAGAAIPAQTETSKPVMTSPMEGISGAAWLRFGVVTPSPRTLPARICGMPTA